jgi:hypothetical protein
MVALATVAAVSAALLLLDSSSPTAIELNSDVLALMALVVLAVPAWLTLHARDPRRFVLGVLGAAVLWLLLWYPNLSGLPMPPQLAGLYQALLPTWNHAFQFATNTDPALNGGVVTVGTLMIGLITLVFVAAVGWAARRWGGHDAETGRPRGTS